MKNEMEGFVLFPGPRSGYDSSVGLLIGKTYVRLTGGAWRQCGQPDFVNVFFDENTKRMMIKKANAKDPNVYKCSTKGYINSLVIRKFLLQLIGAEDVEAQLRFEGHNPGAQSTVIFDLKEGKKIL